MKEHLPEFLAEHPQTYVIYGPKKQIEMAKNMLGALDPSHPMHISNLDKTLVLHDGGTIPDSISRDAIHVAVSWSPATDFTLNIDALQYAHSDKVDPTAAPWYQYKRITNNPLEWDMGCGSAGRGFLIHPEPTADAIKEEDIPRLVDVFSENTELAWQILGASDSEGMSNAIQVIREGNRVIIPLYSDAELNATEYIRSVKESPIMQGKHLVFVLTGKATVDGELESEKCTILTGGQMSQDIYDAIDRLKTSSIVFASGDNTLLATLNAGAMPNVIGTGFFTKSYPAFKRVIDEMRQKNIEGVDSKLHEALMNFLNAPEQTRASLITSDLLNYWKGIVIPYIYKNWDYNKILSKMMNQIVALYDLIKDPTKTDLWNQFDEVEKMNLFHDYRYDMNGFRTHAGPKFLTSLARNLDPKIADILAMEKDPENYVKSRFDAFGQMPDSDRSAENLKNALTLSDNQFLLWEFFSKKGYTLDTLKLALGMIDDEPETVVAEPEQAILEPPPSEQKKVTATRVYICKMGGGMGNLQHFIDRASANMLLDEEFMEDNPAVYVLYINKDDSRMQNVLNTLQALDPSHPLHIDNLGKSFYFGYDAPTDLTKGAIRHVVSLGSDFNDADEGVTIRSFQFMYSDETNKDDPFNRHMGFGPGGYGFTVKHEPTIKTLKDIDEPNLVTDLFRLDPNIAAQIFGDVSISKAMKAIKAFKAGERVLISIYHQKDNLDNYIDAIANSEYVRLAHPGAHLVFLATGKGMSNEVINRENLTIIKRQYLDEKALNLIHQLKTSDIGPASGDNTFQMALNGCSVPIVFGDHSAFSKSYPFFTKVIAEMEEKGIPGLIADKHKQIVNFLKAESITEKLSLLTPELVKYWQDVYVPYLIENWNYNKIIPIMEEQSIALIGLQQDPTQTYLWKKFSDAEKLNTFIHYSSPWNFKMVASLVGSLDTYIARTIASKPEEYVKQRADATMQMPTPDRSVESLKRVFQLSDERFGIWKTLGHYTLDELNLASSLSKEYLPFLALNWLPKTVEGLEKFKTLTKEEVAELDGIFLRMSAELRDIFYSITKDPSAIATIDEALRKISQLSDIKIDIFKHLVSTDRTIANLYEIADMKPTPVDTILVRIFNSLVSTDRTIANLYKIVDMKPTSADITLVKIFEELFSWEDHTFANLEKIISSAKPSPFDVKIFEALNWEEHTFANLEKISQMKLTDVQANAFLASRSSSWLPRTVEGLEKFKTLTKEEIAELDGIFLGLSREQKNIFNSITNDPSAIATIDEALRKISQLSDIKIKIFNNLVSSDQTKATLYEIVDMEPMPADVEAFKALNSEDHTFANLEKIISSAKPTPFDVKIFKALDWQEQTFANLEKISHMKLTDAQAKAFNGLDEEEDRTFANLEKISQMATLTDAQAKAFNGLDQGEDRTFANLEKISQMAMLTDAQATAFNNLYSFQRTINNLEEISQMKPSAIVVFNALYSKANMQDLNKISNINPSDDYAKAFVDASWFHKTVETLQTFLDLPIEQITELNNICAGLSQERKEYLLTSRMKRVYIFEPSILKDLSESVPNQLELNIKQLVENNHDRLELLTSSDAIEMYKNGIKFEKLNEMDNKKLNLLTGLVMWISYLKRTSELSFNLTDLVDLSTEQLDQMYNSKSPITKFNQIKDEMAKETALENLIKAAANGELDLVKNLADKMTKETLEKSGKTGWSALTAAAYHRHEEVIKCLVDHHVDINAADANGRTVVTIAALPCTENFPDETGIVGDNKNTKYDKH